MALAHRRCVKRFITSAEHDMSDNIIHLVLARPEGVEGVGGPGTKGLSLFVVPKFMFDVETGELGERNGVNVTNVEKKMGLKVSTTCELTFGEKEPAIGYLVGDVHEGIAQMFKVIEYARMMVGTKAIATLSTGYLNALDYAKNRLQGADLTQMLDKTAPRLDHPPPGRAPFADAAEELRRGHACAGHVHRDGQDKVAQARLTGGEDEMAERINDLLLPIVKGWVPSARTRCWRSRCRRWAVRATCRTTRSSSTSATRRSTPSTRARPRSRVWTSSSEDGPRPVPGDHQGCSRDHRDREEHQRR